MADGPCVGVGTAEVPRFSIVTAVHDPEPGHLEECLASVDAQVGPGGAAAPSWEHVVVDDASSRSDVLAVLDRARTDERRTVQCRPTTGGIAVASNDALALAGGDWVVLLDHDDVLVSTALAALAAEIDRCEAAGTPTDVVYSDHDLLRADGRTTSPAYKPDFSPERLRHHNYVTHLVAVRRAALAEVGGFREGVDGAQDHDLLLRLAERGRPFAHVREVLLHWRQAPTSTATDMANKPAAVDAGRRAVADHLSRVGIAADVEPGVVPGTLRIRRHLPGRPSVSVIVPTRGSRGRVWGVERIFVHDAVASLLADADDRGDVDLEIVAVVDAGTDPVVERGLRRLVGDRLVVVGFDRPFNFSEKIEAGVEASAGEYLLFLNDDTELVAPGSVAEMVGLAREPDVGLVGAKLLFEDGTLQHGGQVFADHIGHACLGWPGDHPGPLHGLAITRECSGVTAAAALTRRAVHDEIGGMDPAFPVNYNDVDYSFRVRRAGHRILWTPRAVWFHFEQRSGAHPVGDDEIARMRERWNDEMRHDPYYHPLLQPGRCDWLERPLRSGAPPYVVLPDGRVSWG